MSQNATITVVKRTFEASQHPKGSPERARLNLSCLTSEYMPSYRYALSDGSNTFRTKGEGDVALTLRK